jgi:periplasmic protein TonB
METKKNENVDLTRKKPLFFNIGLCISLALVLGAFSLSVPEILKPIDLENAELSEENILQDIPITNYTPVKPLPVQPEILVVPNEKKIDKIEFITPEDTTMKESKAIYDPNAKKIPVETNIVLKTKEEETEEPDKILEYVPEKAEFPGGYKEFQKFIRDNYEYPRADRRIGTQGKIMVQFVVEKNGSITDIKILKGLSVSCDAEAIRVLKKVPAWKPAKQRGRNVRNRITLPIQLKLD